MIRIIIRNRMMVHYAVMVALSLACHSEGVGPMGVRSCFQLCEHGVHVCGNQWMCGYLSSRGVGGKVVTALSSFAFPMIRYSNRSSVKSLSAGYLAAGISPHLRLSSYSIYC